MAQLKGDDGSNSGFDPLGPALIEQIFGISDYAVWGDTQYGYGVVGSSRTGPGVFGHSESEPVPPSSLLGTVVGPSPPPAPAVLGISTNGTGVKGISGADSGIGVNGQASQGAGVRGESDGGPGVLGTSTEDTGVRGISDGEYGAGVYGECRNVGSGVRGVTRVDYPPGSAGVQGSSYAATIGVFGDTADTGEGTGVWGDTAGIGTGVRGSSENGIGVYGECLYGAKVVRRARPSAGVFGRCPAVEGSYAGYFDGYVYVGNYLLKAGGGYRIDDPRAPATRYLQHSFVESSEMKNVYDDVVQLDEKGEATVSLPDWFEVLNEEFRYQLTAIGAAGPNLHIAEEINANHFKISGGTPGSKVSWQVTGIRKDPWAKAHQMKVVEEKPAHERDCFLHPELYNQPEEMALAHRFYRPPHSATPRAGRPGPSRGVAGD